MPFTIDPEVGATLAAMMGPSPPPPPPVGDIEGRRALLNGLFGALIAQAPAVTDVDVKEYQTKAEDGHEIKLRWYTKKSSTLPGSAVAYAHGGGYIALTIDQYDEIAKRYVTRTGVPFLVIDYRLAPEVMAPVHVTDTYAGFKWLHEHAGELGVDTNRIAIMGDSAGGGITASLAHYIKLKGGPPAKKQILIYPMLDDRNIELDENIAPFATWTRDDNETGWKAVLGDKMGTDDVDPVYAAGRMTVQDARGLPPCYMDVGELDNFRDEDIAYAQKLGRAGVECEFHLFPQVPHAWQDLAPDAKVSRQVMELRFAALKTI